MKLMTLSSVFPGGGGGEAICQIGFYSVSPTDYPPVYVYPSRGLVV